MNKVVSNLRLAAFEASHSSRPVYSRGRAVGATIQSAEKKLLYPVLVRGLGKFSADDVKELFNDCGSVRCVHQSGEGKWLVYFPDKVSAALGQRLNGTDFEGNCIRCSTLKPSTPPPAALAPPKKELLSFSVVVNNVPEHITLEKIEVAARKFGEVVRVKMDKKKRGGAWIEFKDKISARKLSRKGLQVDDVKCSAVRVRPITPPSQLRPAKAEAEGERRTKTLMVTQLPAAADGPHLRHQLRRLFSACGNVTQVRISSARRLGFIDFATVTAMRKAKRGNWSLDGVPLAVGTCRHRLPAPAQGNTARAAAPKHHLPPPPGCRTILVKNLPYSMTAQGLRRLFVGIGGVTDVRLLESPQPPPRPSGLGGGREGSRSGWSGFAYLDFRCKSTDTH